jgi:Mn-dependent DtxR family transcriptional regulator
MQQYRRQLAPHSMIVQILRDYSHVSVDFLSKVLATDKPVVDGYLQELKAKGVVMVDGDDVSLTPTPRNRPALHGG